MKSVEQELKTDANELIKIVHDETETALETLDMSSANIWSSTTLYTKEVREKREQWFKTWLSKNRIPNAEHIYDFHNSAGDGDDENDLIMSRWGILETLSITQVSVANKQANLAYHDFSQSSVDQKKIILM